MPCSPGWKYHCTGTIRDQKNKKTSQCGCSALRIRQAGRQYTRRETDSSVLVEKEYVLKQRHNEMANKQMMSFTLPFPDIEIKIRGLCSSISSIRE